MEITEVRISLKDRGKLKAFASITFDNSFVVRDLKVISRDGSFFVSMPSKRTPKGGFKDIAHPITNEMRRKIEAAVLEEFEKRLNRSEAMAVNAENSTID